MYNVTTVNIEKEISPTSTVHWFDGVGYNVSTFSADLEKLNTSHTTNMSYMLSYAGYSATAFSLTIPMALITILLICMALLLLLLLVHLVVKHLLLFHDFVM